MFKMLLKAPTVLEGFFEAFLPEVGRFIDFQKVEFVDKEKHTFHAKKRTGDLLIKTRFQGRAACFLIHLEHQLVVRQLKRRVGRLTASQEGSIRKLGLSRIEALSEALLDFQSRADLSRWLRQNSK